MRSAEVGGKDYYWHNVGWENADLYPADVVLYSMRGSLTPEQLMEQPTFARLPVAEAGQLHPWTFTSMDYSSQTSYLRELAGDEQESLLRGRQASPTQSVPTRPDGAICGEVVVDDMPS